MFACIAGLIIFLVRLTNQYGQALLRIEQLESGSPGPPEQEPSGRERLLMYGMPVGSVAPNFSLESLDGTTTQLFELRGRRLLVIFISPSCPGSLATLPGLAKIGRLDDILMISTGSPDVNSDLVRKHNVQLPVLLQEQNEVARLYYVESTPSAYLVNRTGQTESPRIDGAAGVLGHALSLATNTTGLSDATTPVGMQASPVAELLRRGDILPAFQVPLLAGGVFDTATPPETRRLLVLIDPMSPASRELLPDLAAIHLHSDGPDVIVITRREPELTIRLAEDQPMPYPIGVQAHHDVSRLIGTLSTPAACVVSAGGYLESDVAIGQQAIFALLKPLRVSSQTWRTRSLSTLLHRKMSV